MVQLKRNLLSVALASATMMLMAQAHAQSADPAAEDAQAAKKKVDDLDGDELPDVDGDEALAADDLDDDEDDIEVDVEVVEPRARSG